jgi:hypothetical protein
LPPPPPHASTGISAPKSRKRGRSEGADTANIVESARTRTKSAWAQRNLMKLCPGHRSGPRRRRCVFFCGNFSLSRIFSV